MNSDLSYLIAGCGVSGKGAARLASFLHLNFSVVDEKDTPELRDFISTLSWKPQDVRFGWSVSDPVPLPRADVVILSPGIRRTNPLYAALQACSGQCISELEFALQHLPCPYVGITGTNGKTTVTELTTKLFQAYGVKAEAAGNIGDSLSDAVIIAETTGLELAVVEISSFQLENMTLPKMPAAAAILNLASDHLDRHGSMMEYAKIKFKLVQDMKSGAVLNRLIRDYAEQLMPQDTGKLWFSSGSRPADGADYIFDSEHKILRNGIPVVDFSSLKLKGTHNAENVMASLALLETVCGEHAIRNDAVLRALQDFEPSAHRIEKFLSKDGIDYINDSKATNPHAVNAALATIAKDRSVLLLLGGLDKAMDFTELKQQAHKVKRAFLAGQCRDRISAAVHDLFPCTLCDSFSGAVHEACHEAVSGDTVMLSPATASMDMFKNYRERGEVFKTLVKQEVLP